MVVSGTKRPQPYLKFMPCRSIDMAVAQKGGQSGQFPDVAKDRIAVPGSDVLPVGADESIALVVRESEPGRLEGWDEIDFTGPGAYRVPVGEHNAMPVAEQVSPVGVTMDHPSREAQS